MIILFNDNLEKAMKRKGISQKELAEILQINASTVTAWKKRGIFPTLEKFIKICEILDTSADELLDLKPPNPKAPPGIINQFSNTELELIDHFRELNREQQDDILDYIELKAKKNKRQEKSLTSAG